MAITWFGEKPKLPDLSKGMPLEDVILLRAPAAYVTVKGFRSVQRLKKKWGKKYPNICGVPS